MHLKQLFAGLGALLALAIAGPVVLAPAPAAAAISQSVSVCNPSFPTQCLKPNADGSINVTGSISASFAAFTPTSATSNASLAVTTSSASVALPTGLTQVVQNTGSQTAFVTFTTGAGTATTAGYPVQAGTQIAFAVNGPTFLNAITSTGTASLTISGGSGVPQLAGGASSGGGGGAVTIVDGGDVTQGATTQTTPCATPTTSGCTIAQIDRAIYAAAIDTTPVAITGSGAAGTPATGVISVQGISSGTALAVSVASLPALPANQSTNEAQINGVTPLMGNGVTGTGSQRVTIASDNTAFNVLTAPALSIVTSVPISVSTAVTTQLVAISGSTVIDVQALDFIAAGTTNVTFEYGTGSLCGTGTTVLTGVYNLTAQVGMSKGNGGATFWTVPAGNALCMVNSQAIQVSGSVTYKQH